jgi:hypothetical protein
LIAAAITFGLALLSKLSAAFLLVPIATFMLLEPDAVEHRGWRGRVGRTVGFTGIAFAFAAVVYAALYLADSARFVAAFTFELDGKHFESLSNPALRIGRFGIDPLQASQTILELFRETPFLLGLAGSGAVLGVAVRTPGVWLYAPWLIVGMAFFLFQMYQPARYFSLVAPAFAFFASHAIHFMAEGAARNTTARQMRNGLLSLYLAFNLAHTGMNAVKNPAVRIHELAAWARAETEVTDRIMSAGYLCTDLPNHAYAHYLLSRSPEELIESVRRYDIDWLVFDDREWNGERYGGALEQHFTRAEDWAFGAIYRVAPAK